jgi:hypothetical protein
MRICRPRPDRRKLLRRGEEIVGSAVDSAKSKDAERSLEFGIATLAGGAPLPPFFISVDSKGR